ncbi:MAG: 4-alpha-glucanotransferase [candidate division KSB1 bacterium]|nr:4-alpha-glucanotransferase [candidate division KSB1 bacterium]
MKLQRGSGILLHITSLPSPFGIGDLGPVAYHFVNLLADAGQRYWQILPLNPTEPIYGNSPYLSVSAFALNPLLMSPELLVSDGLLEEGDLGLAPSFPYDAVDYEQVAAFKTDLFRRAFHRLEGKHLEAFEKFCRQEGQWLADYGLFMALRQAFNGVSWLDWPEPLRDRKSSALAKMKKELLNEIRFYQFQQYIVQKQWQDLRDYCRKRGVQIIGDLPIYVEHGSVDVWCAPQFFKLDSNKRPYVVAGVPPDYFSATGQRWGNPIYDWENLRRDRFSWWAARLKRNLDLLDLVRIDHFRGLVAYWEIPAEEPTAINGKWVQVPTDDLFSAFRAACSEFRVIAEDLGIITDDVKEVLKKYDLPGMKVLQFAFGGDLESNPYLPHNYPENCVVYTGTHDNNTTLGWYRNDATAAERWNLGVYFGREINEQNVVWTLIEAALSSRAAAAIIPMQDVLELDDRGRMNVPGRLDGNWRWKLYPGQVNASAILRLAELSRQHHR